IAKRSICCPAGVVPVAAERIFRNKLIAIVFGPQPRLALIGRGQAILVKTAHKKVPIQLAVINLLAPEGIISILTGESREQLARPGRTWKFQIAILNASASLSIGKHVLIVEPEGKGLASRRCILDLVPRDLHGMRLVHISDELDYLASERAVL